MKTKTLFLVTNLLLYFFAGISAFFFIMVLFTDGINNFRMILNYLPLYLSLILPIYALIAINRIAKVESDNRKLRKIKINALVYGSISVFALIYGFINVFVSFGGNFLAGGPAKYFPLFSRNLMMLGEIKPCPKSAIITMSYCGKTFSKYAIIEVSNSCSI